MIAVAALAVLLVVLLIQGCVNEHAKSSTNASVETTAPPIASPAKAMDAKPEPVPTSPPKQTETSISTSATLKKTPTQTVSRSESIYVVKPGDTLTRIARLHQTTVKALKAANGLQSDLIAVGAKLRLPSA